MDDDIVPRILAAIKQAEQDARTDIDHFEDVPQSTDPRDRYIVKLAKDALRRCAAERRIIERYQAAMSAQDDLDSIRRQHRPADFYGAVRANLVEVWTLRAVLRDLADSYGVAPATEQADQQAASR